MRNAEKEKPLSEIKANVDRPPSAENKNIATEDSVKQTEDDRRVSANSQTLEQKEKKTKDNETPRSSSASAQEIKQEETPSSTENKNVEERPPSAAASSTNALQERPMSPDIHQVTAKKRISHRRKIKKSSRVGRRQLAVLNMRDRLFHKSASGTVGFYS